MLSSSVTPVPRGGTCGVSGYLLPVGVGVGVEMM